MRWQCLHHHDRLDDPRDQLRTSWDLTMWGSFANLQCWSGSLILQGTRSLTFQYTQFSTFTHKWNAHHKFHGWSNKLLYLVQEASKSCLSLCRAQLLCPAAVVPYFKYLAWQLVQALASGDLPADPQTQISLPKTTSSSCMGEWRKHNKRHNYKFY